MMTLAAVAQPEKTTISLSKPKESLCVIFDSGTSLWVPCGSNMTFQGWVDAGVDI